MISWLRGFNHFFQCYLLSSGLGGSNQEQSGYRKIPFEKLGSQLELRIEFLIVWDDDGWEGSIIFFNVICSPVGWEGAIRSNQEQSGYRNIPFEKLGSQLELRIEFLIVWDDDGWEGSIIFFNVICSPVGWEGAIRSNQAIEIFPLKNSGASWSYELSFS